MNKYFIITVDTEGDNLWSYTPGNPIHTANANYIGRFQSLCDKYSFKPVYLTNYEMAQSDTFVSEAIKWLNNKQCEIGLHLHAWNNPPIVDDNVPNTGCQYLIEYSDDVMNDKFQILYNLIQEKFKIQPISHRAGRWAMNESYFKLLEKYGVLIDCSVTPGIDWSNNIGGSLGGSDYSNATKSVHSLERVVEIPPTIRKIRNLRVGTLKHQIKNIIYPDTVWLRPAMCCLKSMKRLVDIVDKEQDCDYLEFMIHSSELMPGGSPYFKTEDSVEKEYDTISGIFDYVKKKGYIGVTLKEYAKLHNYL